MERLGGGAATELFIAGNLTAPSGIWAGLDVRSGATGSLCDVRGGVTERPDAECDLEGDLDGARLFGRLRCEVGIVTVPPFCRWTNKDNLFPFVVLVTMMRLQYRLQYF